MSLRLNLRVTSLKIEKISFFKKVPPGTNFIVFLCDKNYTCILSYIQYSSWSGVQGDGAPHIFLKYSGSPY